MAAILEAMITLQNVSKRFELSSPPILRNLSFSLESPVLGALYGKSGSGKTTLLHLIAGLDRADEGEISVNGYQVNSLTDKAAAEFRLREVGFVFQFSNLLPALTAFENATLPGQLLGTEGGKLRNRVSELFERFSIVDRANAYPHELSGGEQQRVALARALCNSPRVVLADEPTGNLDSESGKKVFAHLAELPAEGVTVLVATHDQELKNLATRVFFLRDGVLVNDE